MLIILGRPYPVENCDLINSTSSSGTGTGSYVVTCDPGFDGGLAQTFNLEVKCIFSDSSL